MAKNETYVGDVAKTYEVTVYRSDTEAALDISGANTSTSRLCYFTKSDGSVVTTTAAFLNGSGTDGTLVITTPSGLFSVDGEYKMQLKLSLSATNVLHTDVHSFDVLPTIY
jgi:hypothetical protein